MSNIQDDYIIGEVVGKGAFSEVHKGINKTSHLPVAIKKVNKARVKNKEELVREVAILRAYVAHQYRAIGLGHPSLPLHLLYPFFPRPSAFTAHLRACLALFPVLISIDHPNVIELFAAYDTDAFSYIVTELLVGGELFDRIVDRGSYSEQDAAGIMRQLLSALQYLHEQQIVHRDLKPENLLCSTMDASARIVISDFGLAVQLGPDEHLKQSCGTPGYAAPEVVARKPYRFEPDVFSAGVILYILLCGYPPFYSDDDNDQELFNATLKGDWCFEDGDWTEVSKTAMELISDMMTLDASRRPTVADILGNDWILGTSAPNKDIHRRVSQQLSRFMAKRRWRKAFNVNRAVGKLLRAGTDAVLLASS
ncbi:uncharacterized protein MONBRDRAFT_23949 [Monosiga brevicollis MX1]|uniref:Protein kinase domain-containing protein n=1 Tax=Monosiga brevicollis TaxID=81824 RepID=A9UVB2_MONBE|nr:uncharacterized protein MONBRDRAFT_23949 [Monosiga brevicollis MX1]EDQ90863.1 predicted protein [Monosiga brevicollis MX1]|eukprot:XP_001744160.1 hypothetical protein [Monosiga brevicollis MX1]